MICQKKTDTTEDLEKMYCAITWILAFKILRSSDKVWNKVWRMSNTMEVAPKMIFDRRQKSYYLQLEQVTSKKLKLHQWSELIGVM